MKYLLLCLMLFLFWLLLSGHFVPLLVMAGMAAAVFATWLVRRMDRIDGEPYYVFPTPELLRFIPWLMMRVIHDNIDVASRILHPDMPIRPVWKRLDVKVDTPLQKATYANSITLTPGTLTTDVKDGYFMVHSLTKENMVWLEKGEMEKRIARTGM